MEEMDTEAEERGDFAEEMANRELLKEMQTEAFRRATRENEFYYREGLKDGFSLYRFVNSG